MLSKLPMCGRTVFTTIVAALVVSLSFCLPAVTSYAAADDPSGTDPEFKNPEGPILKVELMLDDEARETETEQAFQLAGLFKSSCTVGGKAPADAGQPGNFRELFWLKGIKIDSASKGAPPPAGQVSLRVDPAFRNQVFPEGERCEESTVLKLAPNQSELYFPEGVAVPAASDETWTMTFKPAKGSPSSPHCTLYFIRDTELVYPVQALNWKVPFSPPVANADKFTDTKFARPQWRYESVATNAPFCGIKPVHHEDLATATPVATAQPAQTKTAGDNSQIPVFDAAVDGPILTESKLIELETTAGKLHLILDPSLAPNHVTQLYRLLKSGAYTGTPIERYEANFVMQVSLAESKAAGQPSLSANLRSLLRRMPLEVAPQMDGSVIHKKWILSMARDDDDTASGTSSFSILLGEAPHLDKKYTIFGRVLVDPVTVDTIEKIVQQWPTHPWIVKAREIPFR